jgi:putative addiction module component (TIGR02574 family)
MQLALVPKLEYNVRMNTTALKILADALLLPESERSELAASLIDSLDPKVDQGSQQAWESEILRRLADLDTGSVHTVPWPEARRRILDTPNA